MAGAGDGRGGARGARWLGGRTFASLVAGLCAAAAPLFLAQGHQLTVNSFEPLSWLALAWLVAAQLRGAEPRRWVAVGAVLGLALLNKHSAAFYAASLFAGLLLAPERRAVASKWVLAGAGFAALVVLPHVAWQVANGWPMLELLRNGQLYKNAPFALPKFLGEVVLALQPLSLPVWGAGLFFAFARRECRLRFLGWGLIALLALFIALKAKFYYFAPAFPPFLAAGAVQWERWLERWPRIRYAAPAVLDFFGPKLGLPRTVSGHNNYWLFGRGPPGCLRLRGAGAPHSTEPVRHGVRGRAQPVRLPRPEGPARRVLAARPALRVR